MAFENDSEEEMLNKAYAERVASLRAKAEGGDGDAMFELGMIFFWSRHDMKKLRKQAVYWFRRGHNLDHASCTMQLGECYELGHGLQQSFAMATYLYVLAANNGSENACYTLGHNIACEYCDMVRDEKAVTRWFLEMEKATHKDSYPSSRSYAARWLHEHAAKS